MPRRRKRSNSGWIEKGAGVDARCAGSCDGWPARAGGRAAEDRAEPEPAARPHRRTLAQGQAAALNVEQLVLLLVEAQADESALAADLPGQSRAVAGAITSLQRRSRRLARSIWQRWEEFESARERKGYLDAQSADLSEALETLENAIRRIDRENTRPAADDLRYGESGISASCSVAVRRWRSQADHDRRRDSRFQGLQVMAQPPGKKNSTIHLLSGGEKALTAIALVFAMFQPIDAVLPARRGRRATRRYEHRALLHHGAAHVGRSPSSLFINTTRSR